jgi:hypothetical protein
MGTAPNLLKEKERGDDSWLLARRTHPIKVVLLLGVSTPPQLQKTHPPAR